VVDTPTIFWFAVRRAALTVGVSPDRIGRLMLANNHRKFARFDRRWVRTGSDGAQYYDFKGARLPFEEKYRMYKVFFDSLAVYCLNKDRYTPRLAHDLDEWFEGPYGYTGDGIDVRVEPGDVVIDAGAWIGDFSAYAAVRGATSYAFEPTPELFEMVCRTAALNADGAIVPVQKGLGDSAGELGFSVCGLDQNGEGNTFLPHAGYDTIQVKITTIDDFVREQGLSRVDFIKADIEGFERNMLAGARETLQRFAPKLALCTYHLPDDPQVMERLILEANPRYRVVQLGKKLFAQAR
jgi:FkbM family methyltransferase